MVKDHIDRRAVFVQAGRYNQDVLNTYFLTVGQAFVFLEQLADLRMQVFDFANLGGSCGHVKRTVGQVAFGKVRLVIAVCDGVLHLVEERILRQGCLVAVLVIDALRKEHIVVSIYLVNGIKLQGQVESFDQFVVLLKNQVSQMVYKHAISTIVPARAVNISTGEEKEEENQAAE